MFPIFDQNWAENLQQTLNGDTQTCILRLMLAKLLVTWRRDLLKVSLPSCLLLSPLSVSGPVPACDRVWGRLRKAGPRAQVVIPHRSRGSALWLPPALVVLPYQTLPPASSPPSISISLPHVPVKMHYCTLSRSSTVKTRRSISHIEAEAWAWNVQMSKSGRMFRTQIIRWSCPSQKCSVSYVTHCFWSEQER